ncbi:MAG TPA: hypothetical protein VHV26_10275 [Rhizomicrobium sp.]|jgi:hypothetical protein|nr:hypothetical protein [Rhizomicrobium sp.]
MKGIHLAIALQGAAAMFVVFSAAAKADYPQHDWSATLYAGPSTTKFLGAALQNLNLEPTGVMIGLAADRPFLDLGWDVSLAGEGQVTQYLFGHRDTSFAAGLGFEANAPFGISGTTLSFYDGPSYALDPPYTSIGYSRHLWPSWRTKFLNYISLEYAVSLSESHKWDGVFRLYHRSGAFGLFSESDDDGLAVGLGIRHNF